MHAAFGTVIWIVCIVAFVFAIVALMFSGRAWSEMGKGGLVMDRDLPRTPPGSAAAIGERDEEIRAMLEARNARRARRGEAPLDVEAELARLTRATPQVDPALREEVRQLVVARNTRRARAGKPPLDVEAEIERQLREVLE